MNYFGASINQSSTVAETAGVDIENGAFLAVKYDENGNVALNDKKGGIAAGILLPETPNEAHAGDDITIQIKDIGYGKSGAAFSKGTELMSDESGQLIPAESGGFIMGFAMQSATEAGEIIQVDIRKCGYKTTEATV